MKENEQKVLLRSSDDLITAVEQYGFLPFFRNEISGFSIEGYAHEGWLCALSLQQV